MLFKRHRDVIQDRNGTALSGWSVLVQSYTGSAVSIYGNRDGTGGPISNPVVSNTDGIYSFYAADGIYRFVVSKSGFESFTIDDVLIGTGGNTGKGTVLLDDYLDASRTNGAAAWAAAIDVAANLIASTKFAQVELAIEGAKFGVSDTLVIPGIADIIYSNLGMVFPTGTAGAWAEPDTDDLAFWAKYQTATADGKTFSVRKPIIRVDAGNARITLDNINYDGKGNSSVRLSSGIRVLGNTPDRFITGGKGWNVETYGVFVGEDFANSAQIDIDRHEVKPSDATSRLNRTGYAFVNSGNDQFWRGLIGHDAHCVLLNAKYGATTQYSQCDFFNGANFDNTGFFHRLVEYRGNSCTWSGDRSGNGVWRIYNPRIRFEPRKLGLTSGSGPTPPSPIHFIATEADTDLTGYIQLIADTPSELNNSVNQYQFFTEGSGSWAMPTDALGRLRGRINAVGGKNRFQQMSAQTAVTIFGGPMNEGAELLIEDNNTDEAVGVGVLANALRLWSGDMAQWELANDGVLKPMAGNVNPQIGSAAIQLLAYLSTIDGNKAFVLDTASPTLADSQMGMRRKSSNGVEFQFRDMDGNLREWTMPLMATGNAPLVINVAEAPYYLDPSAADNTAGLDTVFAAAGARANIIGPVTVKLPGEYRSKGNHVLSGLVSIWVADTTSHGIKRIEDPDYVGPMLTLIPTVGGSSGGRLRQSIKCLLDGNLAHVHKFSGAVSLGSDVITGIDSALVAAMPIGSIVEIEGMPDWTHNTPATTLLEKPSSTSIRVSAVGVQANTGKPNGIWRETVKFTATATTGSKVLAVSNTTGIKRGMKLLDNTPHHLAIDSDDGGSYSRVASIVPGVSVTMDRAATADGAFDCWAYVEPDGVWVVDANQAVGYASNKEYEAVQFDVRINTTGGNGITIGRGRDQIKIIRPSKITSSYGHNLIATESKDSLFTFETGTPWKSGITMSGSGIRWEGEAYDPRQPSKYKIIDVSDNKADLSHYDMNGMCSFTRAKPGGVPLTQLTAGNHMMHPSDINVGGVTPAYITGKSGHVIHGNGLAFMCTDGATNGKPDYLFQSVGGSHFIWTGGMMYGDIAEPDCPYAIAPCADMRKIHGEYFDLGTGEMVSFDDAGRTDQTFTPIVSCVTPGDLSVSYTVQEGWVSVSDGVATVTIVVEFVPTYTTGIGGASGGIRILGLPSWASPSAAPGNPQIQVSVDSANCDWGAGYTQLHGRVKADGKLSIDKCGDNLAAASMLLASCPSGLPQRFEFFGSWKV